MVQLIASCKHKVVPKFLVPMDGGLQDKLLLYSSCPANVEMVLDIEDIFLVWYIGGLLEIFPHI